MILTISEEVATDKNYLYRSTLWPIVGFLDQRSDPVSDGGGSGNSDQRVSRDILYTDCEQNWREQVMIGMVFKNHIVCQKR